MNDSTKTIAFVAIAAAVLLIAWVARPSLPLAQPEHMEGQQLFKDFTDPLAAASLEIVQYDESTATARPFKVAQVKGRWSIPSHENYPTDAKDQLANAASALMDLKVMRVVSDNPGDHAEYGVVEPGANGSTTGVGTRITVRDKDDKPLLNLIVGKEVPDRPGLRYVRRGGEDPVYVVNLSTDKLTSKFEDWIEKDLLKMSSFDVQGFQIQDYTVVNLGGGQLAMDPRSRMAIVYSDNDPKWKLDKFELYDKGKNDYVLSKLAPDEELNTTKLDAMKSALDDLKIVDVSRKPAGLSSDLKAAGQMEANRETFQSLKSRGFYLVPVGKSYELFSNKGDIRVLMKDGVEYVLRFGEIAGAASEQKSKDKKDAKKDGKKAEASDGPGVNRYLFVMAEFNPDAIPKPELEALPKDDAADAKKPEDKKADAKKDGKPSDAKKDAKDEKKAERERIEKDNKRKQDEYQEKIKKGQEHVKELNARFADWYYVISDDVYKRIHLTRDEIIKKKDKKEDGKKDEAKDAHEGHDHGQLPAMVPAAAAPEVKKDAPAAPAAKEEKKGAPAQAAPAANKASPTPPPPKKETAAPKPKKDAPPAVAKEASKDAPAKAPAKTPADAKK